MLLGIGAACTLAPAASDLRAVPGLAAAGRHDAPSPVADAVHAETHAGEEPQNVERAAAPTEAEPPPLVDAWTLAANEDGAACRDALKSAGYKFQAYPDRKAPDRSGCGIPHAVVVFKGPTGVTYDPPITVDCALARALASVERIVQEEAETHLHAPIVRIGNLGGFACRPRNYRKGASLSAHAFGSAVDLSAFHPKVGRAAVVARDYADAAKPAPGQDDRRRFLRAVYGRLRHHEADLTYAVGPDFNALHHNHFHLDRGGWHFWFNR